MLSHLAEVCIFPNRVRQINLKHVRRVETRPRVLLYSRGHARLIHEIYRLRHNFNFDDCEIITTDGTVRLKL